MGVRFLSDPGESIDALDGTDVVILPAFGVTVQLLQQLDAARLHAGGHDLRLGAQRLEERQALRRAGLHRR